ncbi:MAG: VTT domain-containing protein, partial [Oligoflexales bacterium]|nr:VTT domain-containing protein [Oligoflexales bacterium]
MGFSENEIILWFSQYAYEPWLVYSGIVIISILASFGLPVPEEIMLVSVGMVCYMGSRPDLFPPPYESAKPLDVYMTSIIAFFSVFLADVLVFWLGRTYGDRILSMQFMQRFASAIGRAINWTKRYGAFAAAFFRFTPGLRFPGFFSCGTLGLAWWKFLLADGLAALVSRWRESASRRILASEA